MRTPRAMTRPSRPRCRRTTARSGETPETSPRRRRRAASPPAAPCPSATGSNPRVPVGPDPQLWSIAQPDCTGTGTLTVDATQAHSGTHSLRVDGGGGYCDHIFIANASAIAALGPQVYTRLFVRLASPLGAGSRDVPRHEGQRGQGRRRPHGRTGHGADVQPPVGRRDAAGPEPHGRGRERRSRGQWTCIESHFDETAGTIDTWVDGHEVAGLVETGRPLPT